MQQTDTLLETWSEASRAIIRKRLLQPDAAGRIPADEVRTLAQADGVSIDEVMTRLLPIARLFSRPPISDFHVGAVALGASGAIYPGANLEVRGNALNQTVHAEQFAVSNAYANREQGLAAIAVTAAPCGHCRQFLNEIADGSRIRIIVAGQPQRTLADLLPASFGPSDLGIAGGMLGAPAAELHLSSSDPLARAALDAASHAYAPYSKARSGCAIRTASGRVYAGSYIENAAFNPSLSPLQSALVKLTLGGEQFGAIRNVVLVEMKAAVISQRAATEAVLAAAAREAHLNVVVATG